MDELSELVDEFQAITDKLDYELVEYLDSLPEKRLYHYTSFAGLKNIIKERKLWHTDYRFLNDPTEIEYGKDKILTALSMSKIYDYPYQFDLARKFFDQLSTNLSLYIACFSTEIKKLALWRYYASNGAGCAIGFNENFYALDKSAETLGNAHICKVRYGHKDAFKVINPFIAAYKAYNDKEDLKAFSAFLCYLTPLLLLLKDDSFKEEEEIRLVHIEGKLLIDPSIKEPFYFPDQDRRFIPIPENNLPFVNTVSGNKPVVTHRFWDTDISEIWVGPSCQFAEARNSIYKLLKEQGYDVKNIKIKPCPLPWQS